MRFLPPAFVEAIDEDPKEIRLAVLIENDQGDIWLTSHDDIGEPEGAENFKAVIVNAGATSQEITPERGFSTIGAINIDLLDEGFNDYLRTLDNDFNDTLYNNKVTLYYGFASIAFDDYVQVTPHYVSDISNSVNTYTLSLQDAQRFEKRTIFDDRPVVEARVSAEFGSVDEIVVNTNDLSRFELVDHDSSWTDAPGERVGYLVAKGVNDNGEQAEEWIRYTGKGTTEIEGTTFAQFTGVTRGVFGTQRVDIQGGEQDGNTELEELIYLDLPVGKLLLAVLTGDLFGQPGETLPNHWHAGVGAEFINTSSFELIGSDLWDPENDRGFNLSFVGLGRESAKDWLADQVLRLCNLFIQVDNLGQLYLKRFAAVPQDAPGQMVLDYDNITTVSDIQRNVDHIRNRFQINWEWRPDLDRFVRSNVYIDSDSISRNNVTSDVYSLNMRGVRNSGRNAQTTLQSLAEGIRARFSNPAIMPDVTCFIEDAIALEVGDIVTLDLEKHPDFAGATDTVQMSCEVQRVEYDFLAGTVRLKLFSSDGRPTPIEFDSGVDVVQINHPSSIWTDLADSLAGPGGISGSESGETLTITGGTLGAGFYYYDGDVVVDDGATLNINGTVIIDCRDLTLVNNATINGRGRGQNAGRKDYFGGQDAAQLGVNGRTISPVGSIGSVEGRDRDARETVSPSNTRVGELADIRVDEDGNLLGVDPMAQFYFSSWAQISSPGGEASGFTLAGNGGGQGSGSRHSDGQTASGGASTAGGTGLMLFVENLFAGAAATIDTSGADNNAGGFYDRTSGNNTARVYAGAGGYGWPGALIVFVKNRNSALPILDNVHVAQTGDFIESFEDDSGFAGNLLRVGDQRLKLSAAWYAIGLLGVAQDSFGGPRLPSAALFADRDYGPDARRIRYLAQDVPAPKTPGVDRTGPAELPTNLTVEESRDTPTTPTGDQSTLTLTVTPPDDPLYSHTLFQYRAQGQQQWFDAQYGIRNETTVQVTSNGLTYEIRARSVSRTGQVSTGDIRVEYTVFDAVREFDRDGSLRLPDIYGLQLDNRVAPTVFDQFESGNAEFSWQGRTARGDVLGLDEGELGLDATGRDPNFRDYQVTITDPQGRIKRTAYTTNELYIYTREDNRRDGTGRAFTVEVASRGFNGQFGESERLTVENPAPEVVSNIDIEYTREDITVSYELPLDIDFIGVRARGKLYSGNSITLQPLTSRSETLSLVSVDEFGDGATASVALTNPAPGPVTNVDTSVGVGSISVSFNPPTGDYDYVGVDVRFREAGGSYGPVRRYETTTFTQQGLDQGTEYEFEITTVDTLGAGDTVTVSATTVQLEAPDVEGLGEWATLLDAADLQFIQDNVAEDAIPSTRIQSLIAGKIAAGAIAVQVDIGEDANRVLLDGETGIVQTISGSGTFESVMGVHSVDGVTYSFSQNDGNTITFGLTPGGDAFFGGELQAASGTFAGTLQAVDGEFTGTLTGVDGTFSGDLSAAGGTFSGDLSASGGTFAGTLQAVDGEFTGSLTAATGTFSGDLSASGGTFSGTLQAADGEFTGTLTAVDGTFNGDLVAGSFATATSGERIEINTGGQSNRIAAFDSSGDVQLRIGQLTVEGDQFGLDAERAIVGSLAARRILSNPRFAADSDIILEPSNPGGVIVQAGGVTSVTRFHFAVVGSGFSPLVALLSELGSYSFLCTTDAEFSGDVDINGDLDVTGSKNFAIKHPTKDDHKLYHGAYEGPVPGGNLYRERVTVVGGTATLDMPDWFEHINCDIDIICQPYRHFGRAYGEVKGNEVTITADTDGDYIIIILGTRCDPGVANWKGVERKQ